MDISDDWHYLVIAVLLAMASAMFSGLTLGLMSLDVMQLRVIMDAGSGPDCTSEKATDARRAKNILRVRKDGNYLLVTLLIGNVCVNSAFSILLGIMTTGLIGFLVSAIVITMFGEILPQAVCSRHGLSIGNTFVPVVLFLEYLLAPLVKPIAMVLDWFLGREIGNVLDRHQLKALVALQQEECEPMLLESEAKIVGGGLDFATKKVRAVMTPIEEVFYVDIHDCLDFPTAAKIISQGYSRIPVFRGGQATGLIYAKDIVLVDPYKNLQFKKLLALFGRTVYTVNQNAALISVLTEFKKGKTHLAIVRDDTGKHIGLVTLEDILEEILQDEIYDEFEYGHESVVFGKDVKRSKGRSGDIRRDPKVAEARLRLFDKRRGPERLGDSEAMAVGVYLAAAEPNLFSRIDIDVLSSYLQTLNIWTPPKGVVIYEEDAATNFCVLVLQGWLTVKIGKEPLTVRINEWTVLCAGALMPPIGQPETMEEARRAFPLRSYYCDFQAIVENDVKLLKMTNEEYQELIIQTIKVRTKVEEVV